MSKQSGPEVEARTELLVSQEGYISTFSNCIAIHYGF